MVRKYWIKKIFVMLMVCLLVVLLAGCHLSDQILAKKMLGKYSDDQNYVTLIGEVIEIDGYHVTIKCEELNDYISYEDEFCAYLIYSDQLVEVQAGEEIQFTTVPFHFYNGHRLPIVELKVNGNTLLSYDEGKRNLLEWVNETFA